MIDLLRALQNIDEMSFKSEERMPYQTAKEMADEVKRALLSAGVKDADIEYGGSLRRQSTTVGDVDILCFEDGITTDTWLNVIKELEKTHKIEREYTDPKGQVRKMPMGDMQTSFLMDGQNVDLKKYSPDNRGAMMVHATGNKDFNIGMRAWLKSFGWGFSQAGLKNDKGEVIAAKDEKDIFDKMGIPFIEPKDRVGFTPPKNPPPGAKRGGGAKEPGPEQGIPANVYTKLPQEVKDKLRSFKLPDKDMQGNAIPRDFMWNPKARHQFYKRRGTYRLPHEMKLDQYMKPNEGFAIATDYFTR